MSIKILRETDTNFLIKLLIEEGGNISKVLRILKIFPHDKRCRKILEDLLPKELPRVPNRINYKERKDKINNLIKDCFSWASLLEKLNMTPHASNYKNVQKIVKENNIDISHFNVKEDRKNRKKINPEKDLFKIGIPGQRKTNLRNFIFNNKIIEYKCIKCGNPGIHLNQELTLQLDHINGISYDNRLENLRWLCPNCHSQTPTHGFKNRTHQLMGSVWSPKSDLNQ